MGELTPALPRSEPRPVGSSSVKAVLGEEGFPRTGGMVEEAVPSTWLTSQESAPPEEPAALPDDAPSWAREARAGNLYGATADLIAEHPDGLVLRQVRDRLGRYVDTSGAMSFQMTTPTGSTYVVAEPCSHRLIYAIRKLYERQVIDVVLRAGKVRFIAAETT